MKIQGIKLFSNYQISIAGGNLVIRNLTTNVSYGKLSVVASTTDNYQIIVQKLVDISIIIINTNPSTTEDIVAIEFDIVANTFTTKSFTGLTNKNFKCGTFYQGKLLLGGNPSAPAVLYYSKTFSGLSLANIYDFSGYNGGSQPIGDGEAIVGFASNTTEFFIHKKNSTFKITGDNDDKVTPGYAYVIKQETSTGAINTYCIVNVEKDIIYFDGSTIRRVSYEANIQALSDSAIGKDIEPFIESLTQSQELNGFGVYSYPFVKFYLKDNTSSVNNFAILYNTVDKSFSFQQGVEGSCGTEGKVNNKRTTYIGSQFDTVIFKDNYGNNYNGGDIYRYGKSKELNMGDGVGYNQYFEFEMKGEIQVGASVEVRVIVDGKQIASKFIKSSNSTNLSSTAGSSQFGSSLVGSNNGLKNINTTPFELRIPLYSVGRELEYEFSGTFQGKLDISGVSVSFTRKKEYDTI